MESKSDIHFRRLSPKNPGKEKKIVNIRGSASDQRKWMPGLDSAGQNTRSHSVNRGNYRCAIFKRGAPNSPG